MPLPVSMLCRMTSPETKTILAVFKPASRACDWIMWSCSEDTAHTHLVQWLTIVAHNIRVLYEQWSCGTDPIKSHVGLQVSARWHIRH